MAFTLNANDLLSYAELKPGHLYRFVGYDSDDSLHLFSGKPELPKEKPWIICGRIVPGDVFLVLDVHRCDPHLHSSAFIIEILISGGRCFTYFDVDFCPSQEEISRLFKAV